MKNISLTLALFLSSTVYAKQGTTPATIEIHFDDGTVQVMDAKQYRVVSRTSSSDALTECLNDLDEAERMLEEPSTFDEEGGGDEDSLDSQVLIFQQIFLSQERLNRLTLSLGGARNVDKKTSVLPVSGLRYSRKVSAAEPWSLGLGVLVEGRSIVNGTVDISYDF